MVVPRSVPRPSLSSSLIQPSSRAFDNDIRKPISAVDGHTRTVETVSQQNSKARELLAVFGDIAHAGAGGWERPLVATPLTAALTAMRPLPEALGRPFDR